MDAGRPSATAMAVAVSRDSHRAYEAPLPLPWVGFPGRMGGMPDATGVLSL